MKTVVQLREGAGRTLLRADLLFGRPCAVVTGSLGPVALFEPGELVAYRLTHRRRTHVFVFRTVEVDDRLAARVPGVTPRVQLVFHLRSTGRASLVRGLFAYLVKHRGNPATLPDDFYVRVGVVLKGHLARRKILTSLLARSEEDPLRSRR
jgi:hypothetical protein